MKYYIIAGEASGDLHGANLMKALKNKDPEADMRIWGGDLMENAGGTLVKHYQDLAFMGFVEVLMNIRTILRNIRFCKKDILDFQPDALILIDYPGFNLRIAKWAKAQGLKVFYYISPQLWAWHSSRVEGIKASVDHLFVILPFEADFYKKYDYEVDFVGHPLLDVVESHPVNPAFRADNGLSDRRLIALLPGSRRQEIKKMLDLMLACVPDFPDYQFVVAGAPSIPRDFYRSLLQEKLQGGSHPPVKLVDNQTYDLLQHAHGALVTSGTATLETGLFKVPQVVCYRGNKISAWIARRVVNVDYISLVNLIVGRLVVKELIQEELTVKKLKKALAEILEEGQRQRIAEGYDTLRKKLGEPGASARAAGLIWGYLGRG